MCREINWEAVTSMIPGVVFDTASTLQSDDLEVGYLEALINMLPELFQAEQHESPADGGMGDAVAGSGSSTGAAAGSTSYHQSKEMKGVLDRESRWVKSKSRSQEISSITNSRFKKNAKAIFEALKQDVDKRVLIVEAADKGRSSASSKAQKRVLQEFEQFMETARNAFESWSAPAPPPKPAPQPKPKPKQSSKQLALMQLQLPQGSQGSQPPHSHLASEVASEIAAMLPLQPLSSHPTPQAASDSEDLKEKVRGLEQSLELERLKSQVTAAADSKSEKTSQELLRTLGETMGLHLDADMTSAQMFVRTASQVAVSKHATELEALRRTHEAQLATEREQGSTRLLDATVRHGKNEMSTLQSGYQQLLLLQNYASNRLTDVLTEDKDRLWHGQVPPKRGLMGPPPPPPAFKRPCHNPQPPVPSLLPPQQQPLPQMLALPPPDSPRFWSVPSSPFHHQQPPPSPFQQQQPPPSPYHQQQPPPSPFTQQQQQPLPQVKIPPPPPQHQRQPLPQLLPPPPLESLQNPSVAPSPYYQQQPHYQPIQQPMQQPPPSPFAHHQQQQQQPRWPPQPQQPTQQQPPPSPFDHQQQQPPREQSPPPQLPQPPPPPQQIPSAAPPPPQPPQQPLPPQQSVNPVAAAASAPSGSDPVAAAAAATGPSSASGCVSASAPVPVATAANATADSTSRLMAFANGCQPLPPDMIPFRCLAYIRAEHQWKAATITGNEAGGYAVRITGADHLTAQVVHFSEVQDHPAASTDYWQSTAEPPMSGFNEHGTMGGIFRGHQQ